ncbi:sugar-binding transcriptional regulator [Pelagibius litoralis]|uniref:Sugar-binding transcriptional regulator n=1 Tax=Pelagibius litoralis TaxID=374515 RepID=A0A967C4A5_9PROT|nr:sugar-binding transcriptional regulator [Pelagibius litoralis]NIA68334.1 sugar-binding transcriptional regulator [Pelagibius litoralis]
MPSSPGSSSPSTDRQTDKRRDDAARAAWLYFIGGRTQDEIATQLDLSRQAVQRLVALAVSEKLIKFRLDHPIASCTELAASLAERHGLAFCDVTPSDPAAPGSTSGIAVAAAVRLQRLLASKAPMIVCVGTGRTLRAAVEELDTLDRPQHKVVSLVGAMAAGGQASPYDVVMRLGDKVAAQRYPMPAPVLTETVADREALQSQRAFTVLRELRDQARASFVGISEIGWQAPIQSDGFMTDSDISALIEAGAVGEITGWAFDAEGRPLDSPVNRRVASLPLEIPPQRLTVVVGGGPQKVAPLKAALRGKLMSALITDEATAKALVDQPGDIR